VLIFHFNRNKVYKLSSFITRWCVKRDGVCLPWVGIGFHFRSTDEMVPLGVVDVHVLCVSKAEISASRGINLC
jgi:hypothetical protein